MPELPWEKWFPTNWASEPGLRLCEAATRGIWFEAVNTMMLQQTASISGTIEQLASLCICRTSQMELAIEQLKTFKVAQVSQHNGNITLTNRKRLRDCNIRELRRKAGNISATKRQHTPQHDVPTPSAYASASVSDSTSDSGSLNGVIGKPYGPDCRSVLFILNEATGRRFRETESNLAVIEARLREPDVTLDGVRLMIARQVKRWKGTTQEEYLRPETLFSKTKFDSYYAARELPIANGEAHQQVNPRLVGVAHNPANDYGAAARAKSKLAGQVAQAGHKAAS